MKILDKLYNKDTKKVNFNFFETDRIFQPYIENLKIQGFHKQWHNEGCALNHMKLVHNAMCELCDEYNIEGIERMILVVSAFLHDIGKSVTGILKEDGNWSFPNHAPIGGNIVRTILWDEDINIRESICFFVRNHMKPQYILHSKKKEYDMFKLSYECQFLPKITTLRNLWLIKVSDMLGCQKDETIEDDCEESLDFFKSLAIDLRIWDGKIKSCDKYRFENKFDFFKYFNENKGEIFPSVQYDNCEFNCYIMCGISGSGKSTITQNLDELKGLPIISRDITRINLGICSKSEKKKGSKKEEDKVTKVNDELISSLINEKKSFIIDDMNIRKEYREKIINNIRNHNGKPIIVYVEADSFDTLVERRKNEVPKNILSDMRRYMSFPMPYEAVELYICKQGNEIMKLPIL